MARGPSSVADIQNWRADARCLGSDPDLFFPLGGTGAPLAQAQAAKDVCRECTVRVLCLQFALETNQGTGVWGGTDEDERRSLRRNWVRSGRPSLDTLIPTG
jgi:WhiB family redox-sensing transcriptional regulator